MHKKKKSLVQQLFDDIQSHHPDYNRELLIIAIYHDLKVWDPGHSTQKLPAILIAEIETLYPGIKDTNPPYEVYLDTSVLEWLECKTKSYDFFPPSKDNYNIRDLLATTDGKKATEKKREYNSHIDRTLFKLLPTLKQPEFTHNYDIEVARQIRSALKEFWYPENMQTIGVAQRYEQFTNNVLNMAMLNNYSFADLGNEVTYNSLSIYLFLFQYLELGDVYTKEACAVWAQHLKTQYKHVDGHKNISNTLMLQGMMGDFTPDTEKCIQQYNSLASIIEPYVTGRFEGKDGYISADLWQYPNKELTMLSIDVKSDSIDMLNHHTGQTMKGLSFDEVFDILEKKFIHNT